MLPDLWDAVLLVVLTITVVAFGLAALVAGVAVGGAWGVAGPVGDRTGPLGPSWWKLPADPDPGDLAPVSH